MYHFSELLYITQIVQDRMWVYLGDFVQKLAIINFSNCNVFEPSGALRARARLRHFFGEGHAFFVKLLNIFLNKKLVEQ